VRDIMTHTFDLADYPRAIEALNDPTSGAIKIIIRP